MLAMATSNLFSQAADAFRKTIDFPFAPYADHCEAMAAYCKAQAQIKKAESVVQDMLYAERAGRLQAAAIILGDISKKKLTLNDAVKAKIRELSATVAAMLPQAENETRVIANEPPMAVEKLSPIEPKIIAKVIPFTLPADLKPYDAVVPLPVRQSLMKFNVCFIYLFLLFSFFFFLFFFFLFFFFLFSFFFLFIFLLFT